MRRNATAPVPARPDHVTGAWAPPDEWGAANDGVDDVTRYATNAARPVRLLAMRVGLWMAVGLGCVGGVVGLVRPSGAETPPPAESPDSSAVPAAVAGTAELAVTAWLTADGEDHARMDALFVEPPDVQEAATDRMIVERAAVVAGRPLAEGYWTVTVAVDLIDTAVPSDEPEIDHSDGAADAAPGGEAADGDAAPEGEPEESIAEVTWYVEVGIVGDPGTGVAALATPAVLPGPPSPPEGWGVGDTGVEPLDPDDPVATMVTGFLEATLTGSGDPARYLAPGVEIPSSSRPTFSQVAVRSVVVSEIEPGVARARVQVVATTAQGSRQVTAYTIVAAERADRWEVRELGGAPVARRSTTEQQAGATSTTEMSGP